MYSDCGSECVGIFMWVYVIFGVCVVCGYVGMCVHRKCASCVLMSMVAVSWHVCFMNNRSDCTFIVFM